MRPASGRSRANFEEPEQQMLKIVRNLDNPLKSGLLQQPAKGGHRRRAMAKALQHAPVALRAELPVSCNANLIARNTPSGSESRDAVVSVKLLQDIRRLTTCMWSKH
jgi:hypothetical protein